MRITSPGLSLPCSVKEVSIALLSPMWQTMFRRVGEPPRLGFLQALHPPLSYAETSPLVSSPPPSTFQVSASVAIAALVYMRLFLQDSIIDEQLTTPILTYKGIGKGKGKAIEQLTTPILTYKGNGKGKANAGCCANEIPIKDVRVFKSAPSLEDMLCLLKSSVTLSQAAVVAFFYSLAEVGLHASLMYYLKAQFHFSKDQFADLMVISGIAGTVSQLVIMPILTPALGETRLLAVGLFFTCVHVFLYSIAWTFWVPYVAAMFSILFVFSHPCMRSIVSKQVGSCEQGKAQGCISGISSFANVISPLVFSPLTALFLSEGAPFPFPGFSIMCVGFASVRAFTLWFVSTEQQPKLNLFYNELPVISSKRPGI
ncbi:hypothetical protein OIU84_013858 [Salix udensis]|uniref:Uncharacterized protein n=1 Tax=Salix udensis TaxID=889485 RepID=A0AAD6NV02_9ROSI|nr:hypothetical protein OIU84_013858 [Salix udensis]